MPPIISRVTEWKSVFTVNVRLKEGCPLHENGKCGHPHFALAKSNDCVIAVGGALCPLERHPVVFHRVPEWLDDAEQQAIHDRHMRMG
jgi:hypothetical protein